MIYVIRLKGERVGAYKNREEANQGLELDYRFTSVLGYTKADYTITEEPL